MNKVKFFALGGMDEHGKNAYVFEINNNIFVFDYGFSFPENEIFGIRKIISDPTYLLENKDKIKGIFLSQNAEWFTGALPYLFQNEINATIYCSPSCEFSIKEAMNRLFVSTKRIKFVNLHKNEFIKFNDVIIFPFATFSFSAQSYGFAIKVDNNVYIYLQDFIISNDNNFSFHNDFNSLANFINHSKIQALAIGVNNINNPGFTSPKHKVKTFLNRYIFDYEGRSIIAVYQQDLYTIMSIVSLAKDLHRPLVIFGRTLERHFDFLVENSVINIANLIRENIRDVDKLVNPIIIVAGSTDRLFAKLSKIATGYDELLKITEKDLFISLAPAVSGNETIEAATLDDLSRTDAKIITTANSNILPIKASNEDIKNLINLFKPECLIPIAGMYKDYVELTKAAKDIGFNPKAVYCLNNGDAITFDNGNKTIQNNFLYLKETYVDSIGVSDIGAIILDEREQMGQEGTAVFSIGINSKTKMPATTLDVQMRGVVYIDEENKNIINKISSTILSTIVKYGKNFPDNLYNLKELKYEIKKQATKLIAKYLKKKPMVFASITEID